MKTVWQRLEQMRDDLAKFAAELNKDGLHSDAGRAQDAVIAVDELRAKSSWPSEAKWPPRVTVERAGDIKNTSWSCIE